ncbi:MAG: hypothetical protein ACOZAA_11150 [Pseudomonadota bacterium]
MTEAEITEQMVMMMDLTLSGISVFFTIVSAYTVALYYFLYRAPVGLKLTAFAFFTLTLIFLVAFAVNSFSHAGGLQEALVELGSKGDLSPVGERALGSGLLARGFVDQVIRTMTWVGMALVYFALLHFTFFHRWPSRPAKPAPGQSSGVS